MSESGDDSRPRQQGRRRGNGSDEKELASQQVVIQSKRFYIDVKENQRGRFVKLAEVGTAGRRSRILMSMMVANEFKQKLTEFSELHASLPPTTEQSPAGAVKDSNKKDGGDGGLIKSETLIKERKRYYLDLKENQRGRFLRVSMVMPRGSRAFLAIPAQGLTEFRDHLADMIDRYGPGYLEEPAQPDLPESKSLRVDKKMFYFDCGANERGVFLKVNEVRNRYRSSITIPDNFLFQFRDLLNEYADKIGVVNNTSTVSNPPTQQSEPEAQQPNTANAAKTN